jgi:hypothetical protein
MNKINKKNKHRYKHLYVLNLGVKKLQINNTQCKYNVTLRRVLVNIFEVEKQCVLHIVSVCL